MASSAGPNARFPGSPPRGRPVRTWRFPSAGNMAGCCAPRAGWEQRWPATGSWPPPRQRAPPLLAGALEHATEGLAACRQFASVTSARRLAEALVVLARVQLALGDQAGASAA